MNPETRVIMRFQFHLIHYCRKTKEGKMSKQNNNNNNKMDQCLSVDGIDVFKINGNDDNIYE